MSPFKKPSTSEPQPFYLGWPERERLSSEIGFHVSAANASLDADKRDDLNQAVAYRGDSHYICIAPTGSGKTRSVVIPHLLTSQATCVVLDIKGELYQVTAERRRRLGQRIYVLDPFNLTGRPSHGLNPLDQFKLSTCDVESDAQMVAQNLSAGLEFSDEPFWSEMGTMLTSGILAHLVTAAEANERHLNSLFNYLFADEVVYGLAVLLDSEKVTSNMARRQIAATLQLPEKTRESVIATAQSYVTALQSSGVAKALAQSSFELQDFARGDEMTVYICVPPTKLRSHASLLRLWIGTLLATVCSRATNPPRPTWFIIDEAAQLGYWPQLELVLTLLRGYGVQAATFWQDLSQIKHLYARSWPTILNNAAVIQTFGVSKWQAAEGLAELFGNQPEDLLRLGPAETMVLNGDKVHICRKLDYLTDPVFAGKFRPNPRFGAGNNAPAPG